MLSWFIVKLKHKWIGQEETKTIRLIREPIIACEGWNTWVKVEYDRHLRSQNMTPTKRKKERKEVLMILKDIYVGS